MVDSAPERAPASPAGWRRHRTALAVAAAVTAALLLYTLAGFLLVPHLARNAVIGYVERDLHRRAAIGGLDFNPWTLTLEVRGFSLAEADGRPLAAFELLHVRAALLASLRNRAWTLSEVRLEQPAVHAVVAHDGALNLAQLAPPAGAPANAPKPGAARLPAVRIDSLGVHGGSLHFEDHSRGSPFAITLAPVEFDLTDFRTQPSYQNRYRFSAQTLAHERVDWSGQFSLQPLGSSGELAISHLRVATVAGYLRDALPVRLAGGSLDVQGGYAFLDSPAPSLSLTLSSVRLHTLEVQPRIDADGRPWVVLPELAVEDSRIQLEQRRIAIGRMRLQGAAVQLWRNPDGSLNLQQLAAAPAQAPSGPPAAPSPRAASASMPWRVSLNRLELADAVLDLEDRSVRPAFRTRLSAIAFTAHDYDSSADSPVRFDLRMNIGAGGRLETSGSVAPKSLDSSVDLTLAGLGLPQLQPYVAKAAALTLYRGRAGIQGHVDYYPVPPLGKPKLSAALSIDVTDLATRDNVLNAQLLSWRSLRIHGLRYQWAPDALSIARVVARGAYGRVIVGPEGKLNIAELMHPAAAGAAAAAPPAAAGAAPTARPRGRPHRARVAAARAAPGPKAAPSMPIRIARVDIEDSTADFSDRSIEPNFSTAIYDLRGSVTGLSSDPSSRAAISLDGSVDRYAPVSIRGQMNLLSATTYTDIGLDFSNIELPTFNPYSGKYAGYQIAQGKLSTQIHYHVENRKLEATHHIVIDQLEFGAATPSKQAAPLPIKLAVALLKNRDGVIDLNLPVGGSLDDPKFRVGPIIWKMFVNLVEKAATAPFALLGSMFGAGPQLSYIDFPAGAATLTAAQQQKLSQLARALVERPQLKLNIPLHTQDDDDDPALEQQVLTTALQAVEALEAGKRAAGTPDEIRLRSLVALYHTTFRAAPDYPPQVAGSADSAARSRWIEEQLLRQYAPGPAQRDELALARARAVQAALLANPALKPERIFLINQVSGGGPPGFVRMELKLE